MTARSRTKAWRDYEDDVLAGEQSPTPRDERETEQRDIVGCKRCGQDHHGIATYWFLSPIRDTEGEWNWYALCPLTGDPMLMGSDTDMKETA